MTALDNKLIVEFMEWESHFSNIYTKPDDGPDDIKAYMLYELKFHSSWNWLMPVCIRIKDIRNCSSVAFWKEVEGDSLDIENTYNYCVKFIKKWNKNEI